MPPDEPYTRQIRSDESPSIGVVRTIAALKNTPSHEIDPLSKSIDPDALDQLVAHGDGASVEFEYEGLSVTVDGRTVTVRGAVEE
ncbi:HalOD1 output domain-containing protein [Halosimplex aquaticum]|uniref:HalOD1 output domain-containing protein n=1 Tax=Halosimplex aquaticum TaxID=3026162 RepID=A0ABD5Y504_9EURY|nr:HalOD1 output domain-containing protein [Halosimplex aquaticum]